MTAALKAGSIVPWLPVGCQAQQQQAQMMVQGQDDDSRVPFFCVHSEEAPGAGDTALW
jgi:hypothetical protein